MPTGLAMHSHGSLLPATRTAPKAGRRRSSPSAWPRTPGAQRSRSSSASVCAPLWRAGTALHARAGRPARATGMRRRGRLPQCRQLRCFSSAISLRRSKPCSPRRPVPRRRGRRIVEVGHLAATRAGEGRRLILLLGPHLAAQRFEWVVGTVTRSCASLFLRIGITPLTLGAADPAALGDEAGHWGSYYEHRPLVLAGHLRRRCGACAGRKQRGWRDERRARRPMRRARRRHSAAWSAAELEDLRLGLRRCSAQGTRVLATLMDNSPAWVVADLAAARGRHRPRAAAGVLHARADRPCAAGGGRRRAAALPAAGAAAGRRRRHSH